LSTSFFMTTVVKPVQLALAAETTTLGTTDTKVYSTNPFLNQIIPSATVIAAQNDLYASVMMAQAILESGWGTSTLSKAPNYNLFGIKGQYNGESINMETLEDSGGQNYYPINAEFRKYPSYAESLQDYANLLANGTSWNPTYYAGAWKSNAATYQDATAYLTGRYATDTAYSTKLNRIIAQYGLDQYDNYQPVIEEEVEEPDAGNIDFETPIETPELPNVELPENTDEETPTEPTEDKEDAVTPTTPETPVQAGDAVHVVKSGDTLYAIAKKYGISLVDLLSLNKLNSNMIYVGDRLVLPDSVVVEEEVEEETTAPSTPNETPSDTTTASYTVIAGDTLYKIANAKGLTISELKSLNTLTSDTIYVGQKLLLGKATTTTPDTTENGSNSNTGQTTTQSYTVKSGDTLWSIANTNNMTVTALKSANSLTSDAIYPGQILKTTGTSTGTTTPTTGTNTGTTGTTITGAFIKPASGYISSPFGYRTSPINGALEFHRGIDIAGSGNISAAQAGVVEVAAYHYSYGNYVVINHGKINGVTIKTLYAHMQSGLSVSVGQAVSQGQKIGVMGTTGSSTGVHLHFEVQENGTVVNPVNYINGTTTVTPGVTTPTTPTTTPSTGSSVVVVSGDTLWKIATTNGLTVAELKTLNNLTSDAILTGQTLVLKSAVTVTPTTPTVTPGTTNVTVASGDTLWKIANANGLSVAELKALNNLTSDVIVPGQTLLLKQTTTTTTPSVTQPTAPTSPSTASTITVASGDTLWKIANANGLSVAELKALNNLTSDVIIPGQTLLLKQTTTTPSVTQPTTPTTPTSPSTASTITVASGDTLWKIANANGLSVSALKTLNSLTSDVIVPGQVLTLKSTTVTAPTVTQPTTTAPTTSTATSTITVATGDTLWKIANANGLTVTELKALNNLSSDYIYPGQSLKVKATATTGNTSTVVTTPTVTTPSVPTVTNKVYTVQKGDTLYKIASANGVSVADLKTWNNLSTDIIFVNQSLKVAATTTSVQATAPTTSAPAASANSYTVVKGDTLYSIAKKNSVSLAALIEANDITSNVIYVGQVITF